MKSMMYERLFRKVSAFLKQAEKCDFTDIHGHKLELNSSYIELVSLIKEIKRLNDKKLIDTLMEIAFEPYQERSELSGLSGFKGMDTKK